MRQRILVIDDDVAVRETLSQILDDAGYDVTIAEDGRKGLAAFTRLAPHLVITDIIMPEKEGIETIVAIRGHDPKAKIIAISGGGRIANADFLAIARQLGAMQVMSKPFDPDELINRVRHCLAA